MSKLGSKRALEMSFYRRSLSEGNWMSSTSLSPEVVESSSEQPDVVSIRWAELGNAANTYAKRSVCASSVFDQDNWDFRAEGVDRLSFDSLIGHEGQRYLPIRLLLKMVALVLLGFNARLDRSYRTAHNILYGGKQLIRWLLHRGYLSSSNPGGYFKLPSELHAEELQLFYDEVAASPWHDNTKFDKVRFLSEWWHLSYSSDYLPSCLRLSSDPFGGKKVGDLFSSNNLEGRAYRAEDDDDARGWLPIPLEFAFPIAKAAVEYIDRYAVSLVKYYEVVYEGVVSIKKGHTVTRGRIVTECAARGITLEELGSNLPFSLNFMRYASPSNPRKYTYRLDRKCADQAFSYIKRAAIVVILFTTGIRARELRRLKVGCCVPDYRIGVDNFYRLTVTVQKTSAEYASGQRITIPVPEITYRAIKVLEALGRGNRRGEILIAPLYNNEKEDRVTDTVCHQTVLNYLQSFCEDSGIDYRPHPHQFRKTIAGWFAMNSPVLGPLLVMTLFSHKKLSMTEMYFRNNPLIRSAREEILLEQSLKLVRSISHAATSGKLAGPSGERLKAGVAADPLFRGLTGDQLAVTIEEYLRERAFHGSNHFLLTPLAICMFNPDDDNEKPCTLLIASTSSDGEDSALNALPLPSACVGAKCDHCLLTDCQSGPLEQSLQFYQELIEGAVAEDYSQNLHLINTAREFVADYTPLLEQIR
ncbi:tyrosine-type recombinase/integrase [Pseudomonas sp. NPDC090201]|uniref:tyrosine-type recombinase/integrase n=1 Tax=Pseudomonas sp. NPDC090201 TaxID=3364475 RepID=UPI00380C4D57